MEEARSERAQEVLELAYRMANLLSTGLDRHACHAYGAHKSGRKPEDLACHNAAKARTAWQLGVPRLQGQGATSTIKPSDPGFLPPPISRADLYGCLLPEKIGAVAEVQYLQPGKDDEPEADNNDLLAQTQYITLSQDASDPNYGQAIKASIVGCLLPLSGEEETDADGQDSGTPDAFPVQLKCLTCLDEEKHLSSEHEQQEADEVGFISSIGKSLLKYAEFWAEYSRVFYDLFFALLPA
ncbi:hypothetical protein L7F22_031557 [Adiantum nelumboides]|nr:hypothetical protein [Adiantum nelumboides]